MRTDNLALTTLVAMVTICGVQGHGYMTDPPARQTLKNPMFGIRDCQTGGAINWSPSGLFCGNAGTQAANGGKCSACGDDYAASYPRTHDLGGPVVKQLTFSRAYLQGQTITVSVDVTAAHRGGFEVRLCPYNERTEGPDDLTQCYLDPGSHYVLRTPTGETKTAVMGTGMYYMEVMLPTDVNCAQGCNLQWWYRTGNSWGTENGQSGLGLGDQEHFVNCADVIILNCDQYNDMKHNPKWCGKGPTPELSDCANKNPPPNDVGANTTNQDSGTDTTDGEGSSPDTPVNSDPDSDNSSETDSNPQTSGSDKGECSDADVATGNGGASSDADDDTGTVDDGEPGDNEIPDAGGDTSGPYPDSGPYAKYPAAWIPTEPAVPADDMTCEECFSGGYDFCSTCCLQETIKVYKGKVASLDGYCEVNCAVGYCPKSHCRVVTRQQLTKVCPLRDVDPSNEDYVAVVAKQPTCDECTDIRAVTCENPCCRKAEVTTYKGVLGRFDVWCANNCARGSCPPSHCVTKSRDVWDDVCKKIFKKLLNKLERREKEQNDI